MALPRDLSGTTDWPTEILEAVKAEWNGEYRVRRPDAAGSYDPAADAWTGGEPGDVVIDWTLGRCQNMLNPSKRAEDWGTAVERRYLFNGEIHEDDDPILKGYLVEWRYLPGTPKRDPELEKMFFRVIGASNSSHAAVRTIYTVSELARK